MRPTGLKDGPAAGTAVVRREDEPGTVPGTVRRADVAACLLHCLQDPSTVGAALSIGG